MATPDGLFLALESLSAAFFALSLLLDQFFLLLFPSLNLTFVLSSAAICFFSSLCFRISTHALLVSTLAPETHFAAAFLFNMLPEHIELSYLDMYLKLISGGDSNVAAPDNRGLFPLVEVSTPDNGVCLHF